MNARSEIGNSSTRNLLQGSGHTQTFLPKQFAVRVLNETLALAALVLVGVAAFFGSEMVLASLARFMWGTMLVGVAGFLGSEVVLARFGSLHVGAGVGWFACFLRL